MFSRDIHTLVSTQNAIILYLCHQHRATILYDAHIKFAVIKQQIITHFHILCDIAIRNIDDIMRAVHLRTTEYFHHITGLILQGNFHSSGTNFRPFRINHDTDMWRNSTHILYNRSYTLWRCMSGIHSNHIHSCEEKLANKILITSPITYRGNNFCLFHIAILNFPAKLKQILHNSKYLLLFYLFLHISLKENRASAFHRHPLPHNTTWDNHQDSL